MIRTSRNSEAMLHAFNKGYRVVDGKAFNPKGKELKGYKRKTPNFYWEFSVWLPSVSKMVSVRFHQLVAYQKFGDRVFESGIEVRHLDNDSQNNHEDNIGLGSPSDNYYDRPVEDRRRAAVKSGKRSRAFSDKQLEVLRKEFEALGVKGGRTRKLVAALGKKYGVSMYTIYRRMKQPYLEECARR